MPVERAVRVGRDLLAIRLDFRLRVKRGLRCLR
jgi:hypothetical protein